MLIAAIPALEGLGPQNVARSDSNAFGAMLGGALENLTQALNQADGLASAVALGKGGIADAAIARAKADVALEVAAVAAARITGAISVLMQTQV